MAKETVFLAEMIHVEVRFALRPPGSDWSDVQVVQDCSSSQVFFSLLVMVMEASDEYLIQLSIRYSLNEWFS